MPVIRRADATVYQVHGSSFTSYAAPASGSTDVCLWRLDVPPGQTGTPHRVTAEEVLLFTSGSVRVTLDGVTSAVAAGDAVLVPAGSSLRVDNDGDQPASAVVATTPALRGELADGTTFTPAWVK
jgi:quercetin dioxygenase-like cupin family protein